MDPKPAKEPRGTTAPIAPTIEFVKSRQQARKAHDLTAKQIPAEPFVNGQDPVATELQMGLFDNAFGPSLLDEVAEADNWVGGDSRRFYVRVVDAAAKGRKFLEADVEWWTSFANNNNRDHGAGEVHDDPSSKLSLFEVPGQPGVFVSRALMLVCDDDDRGLLTNSGIPSGHPLFAGHGGRRNDQQSNFRVRRAGMHGFAAAVYAPKGSSSTFKTAAVPVFKQSSQKLLPLQVYVVRNSVGGSPCIAPQDIFKMDLPGVTETYARIGLWCWTFVSNTDRAKAGVEVVTATSGLPYSIAVIDPPGGMGVAVVTEHEEAALAAAFPGEPNTLRMFFVPSLQQVLDVPTTLLLGYSNPPDGSLEPKGRPAVTPQEVGTTFVDIPRLAYVAAHELGHCLTNESHFNGGGRHPTLNNLMGAGAFVADPGKAGRGVGGGKRLWRVDVDGSPGGLKPFQIDAILSSEFTR